MSSDVLQGAEDLACPHCGDNEQFREHLRLSWVYVPDEVEPAREEDEIRDFCLLGAEHCRRPDWRHVVSSHSVAEDQFDPDEEVVCKDCGGVIHRHCAGPPWNDEHFQGKEPDWACNGCRPVRDDSGSLHDSPNHSLTHSLTHPLTHSLTHSQPMEEGEVRKGAEAGGRAEKRALEVMLGGECSGRSGLGSPGMKRRAREREPLRSLSPTTSAISAIMELD